MQFLAALHFLTNIPVPWYHKSSPEELGRSTPYFPVVGLIIGLILAGLNWLFNLVLPLPIAYGLLIASLVLITGARHLNGLIHTCDGLAGHKTPVERQQIMQDSRSGAFGIIGAVLLVLVKYISLSSLPGHLLMPTLVITPIVSRWAMVYTVFTCPSVQSSETGKLFKQGTRWPRFTVATVITFVLTLLLMPLFQLTGFVILLGVWLMTTVVAAYFKSQFAGLGSDAHGAINELAEVTAFIIVSILAQIGMA